ncbi:MAG: hypothetical protein Q7S59_11925, partial [Sulfurimonas sp.]|nr:hypothetical protein [Sulfurimonas sp.]
KSLITLFTVSILACGFWFAYDKYTKKLSLNYHLGQFEFALKKLPEHFVGGIKIANYDLIEHQFQEENEILKNIQTLDEERYAELKAEFEILKSKKE